MAPWVPSPVPLCCSAIEALGKTIVFYVNSDSQIAYITAPTGLVTPEAKSHYTKATVDIPQVDPQTGEIDTLPTLSSGPQVSAVIWTNAQSKTEIRVYYVGQDLNAGTYKLRELKSTSPDGVIFGPWAPGALNAKNESCQQDSIVAANVNFWGTRTAADVKVYYQRQSKEPSVAYASVVDGDWSQTDIALKWN